MEKLFNCEEGSRMCYVMCKFVNMCFKKEFKQDFVRFLKLIMKDFLNILKVLNFFENYVRLFDDYRGKIMFKDEKEIINVFFVFIFIEEYLFLNCFLRQVGLRC